VVFALLSGLAAALSLHEISVYEERRLHSKKKYGEANVTLVQRLSRLLFSEESSQEKMSAK
jgi:hypothetical protein